jgi:hypothetical protein
MQDKYVIRGVIKMPRPSFNNIGLRRDLNLSDLPNAPESLDNLLNDLVTTDDGSTFDGNDLNTAIKGIANTSATNQSISKLRGVAVKNTILEDNELVERIASPAITIKNQVDTILATTNDPPFFNGGDGLFADFFEPDAVVEQTSMNINTSGSTIKSGAAASRKKFWTNGLFEFSNKLDDSLGGANGLVQWEGFYIPDASGPTTFAFNTTGLFIFEFENDNGDLEIKRNVYDIERDIFVMNNDGLSTLTVTTTEQEARTLAIGDMLMEIVRPGQSNIIYDEATAPIIENISLSSGVITLNTEVESQLNYEMKFSVETLLGVDEFRVTHVESQLERYTPYKVRMTLWFPGEEVEYFNKVLDANLVTTLRTEGNWPYWYLYTEVGDIEVDEGFKGFYDKRLLLGGGTIGPEDVIIPQQYNKWQSIKPLTMKYDPPLTYAQAEKANYTYSVNNQSNVIGITSTSPYTDNIEIGNYIIAAEIPIGARVTDISSNNLVIFDSLAIAGGSVNVKFLDHRGFLGKEDATSNGNTVTVNNTANLKVGTVIVNVNMPNTGVYCRITQINTNREFETNRPLNLTGSEAIFLYSDRGLNNNAYTGFCTNVIGSEVAVSANPGDSTITCTDVTGVIAGMVVMSSPYLPTLDPDDLINTRTLITNVNTVTKQITIDRTVQGTDQMVVGTTLVFAPSNTTQDKEPCVIPLNTAPPFVGTLEGLRTTDGTETAGVLNVFKGLRMTNASGVLKVTNLVVQDKSDTGSGVVEDFTINPNVSAPAFNRRIGITCAGSSFDILATTDNVTNII